MLRYYNRASITVKLTSSELKIIPHCYSYLHSEYGPPLLEQQCRLSWYGDRDHFFDGLGGIFDVILLHCNCLKLVERLWVYLICYSFVPLQLYGNSGAYAIAIFPCNRHHFYHNNNYKAKCPISLSH